MDRNKDAVIFKLSKLLANENDSDRISHFLSEIMTKTELETISKRWCILESLAEGKTQREISKELKVSLCKVTRGSQILKNKNSIVKRYLRIGDRNE